MSETTKNMNEIWKNAPGYEGLYATFWVKGRRKSAHGHSFKYLGGKS